MKKKSFINYINAAALILTVAVNFLANYLPINNITTGGVSQLYQNPFTPAGYTFSIWGIIYLLLTAFVIFQFRSKEKINDYFSTGPYFLLASAANICWIFAWHYQKIYFSLFFILILLLTLFKLFTRTYKYKNYSAMEYFSIRLPFSVYTAWASIASIANFMVMLKYINSSWPNSFFLFSALAGILAGLYITIRIMEKYHDIAFSLVVIWAYAGIISAQIKLNSPAVIIIITASISIIVISFMLIKNIIFS
ncbi:MAG: hypothetical protein ACQESS_00655 [Bacillota bacterium]